MRRRVLISWIAVNNDPSERDRAGSAFRLVDGSPVPGPTLTLLFDPDSPYAGNISDFVLFYGRSPDGKETRQSRAVSQTLEELKASDPGLRIHQEPWDGNDPTDHGQIFEFLSERPRLSVSSALNHIIPGVTSIYDRHGYESDMRNWFAIRGRHVSVLRRKV